MGFTAIKVVQAQRIFDTDSLQSVSLFSSSSSHSYLSASATTTSFTNPAIATKKADDGPDPYDIKIIIILSFFLLS